VSAAPRRRPWTRARRAIQAAVLAFYVALPLANARGLDQVLGTFSALKLGPVDLVEPAAALTALLAHPAAEGLLALALGVAPVVALALALGPVFCSWACPFGLLSEGLDRALAPLRRPWAPLAQQRAHRPRALALAAVLALSALLAVPLGALLAGPRALTAALQEGLWLGAVSPFAAGLLAALLLADALLPRRLFCRALCPAGAVQNLLRTRRTLRVAFDPARCRCPGAPPCHAGCPWGVDPRHAGLRDGCTSCLACVEVCPSGALTLQGARRATPRPSLSPRRAGRG
jgi:ferredoxin-type protein NapH